MEAIRCLERGVDVAFDLLEIATGLEMRAEGRDRKRWFYEVTIWLQPDGDMDRTMSKLASVAYV